MYEEKTYVGFFTFGPRCHILEQKPTMWFTVWLMRAHFLYAAARESAGEAFLLRNEGAAFEGRGSSITRCGEKSRGPCRPTYCRNSLNKTFRRDSLWAKLSYAESTPGRRGSLERQAADPPSGCWRRERRRGRSGCRWPRCASATGCAAGRRCTPYSGTPRRCRPPPSDWLAGRPGGWACEGSALRGESH